LGENRERASFPIPCRSQSPRAECQRGARAAQRA
jgi:hypothetical protein